MEFGIVWRPKVFLGHSFSVLQSRYQLVVENTESNNEKDSILLVNNICEIITQVLGMSEGLISDFRVL